MCSAVEPRLAAKLIDVLQCVLGLLRKGRTVLWDFEGTFVDDEMADWAAILLSQPVVYAMEVEHVCLVDESTICTQFTVASA